MKKKYRVRSNQDFSKIISRRHVRSSDCFTLFFCPKALEHSRVGISVSKKLGNAVVRNRIKRQIRMMFVQKYDYENSPNDLIVIVRKGYLDRDFSANQNDLEKLIKKTIIKKI